MNPKENMDELLVKYLLGETSEAEQQEAQQWINDSNEHKQHFAALRLIWNESKSLQTQSSVNEQEAWMRFKGRTQQTPKTAKKIALTNTRSAQRIAAGILFIALSSGFGYYLLKNNNTQDIAIKRQTNNSLPDSADKPTVNRPALVNKHIAADTENQAIPIAVVHKNKQQQTPVKHTIKFDEKAIGFKKHTESNRDIAQYNSKDVICNSTPCPIEICINQTMKCPESKPAEISSCSILEPDQAAKLSFKSHDKIAKNCSLSVEEITITSVATGEAIILNDHSSPSTAQDLFKYISGEKKGDILAGVFHADCNNQINDRGLRFDNKTNSWMLQ